MELKSSIGELSKDGYELANDSLKAIAIRHIRIAGLKRTDRSTIDAEMNIKEGDWVLIENLLPKVEENRKILEKTTLFNSVQSTIENWKNDSVDVRFDVKERWFVYVFPYVEIADRNFSEWWIDYHHDLGRLVYGGAFYDYNFRGRKEKLEVWALFGFDQLFELEFDHPSSFLEYEPGVNFIIKYKRSHDIAYNTVDDKLIFHTGEDFVKRFFNADLSLSLPINRFAKHTFRLGYYNYHVSDTILKLNPDFLSNESSIDQFIEAAYNLEIDKTDVPDIPKRGYYFNLGFIKSGFGLFNHSRKHILNASLKKYFDLGNRFFAETDFFLLLSHPFNQPYKFSEALGYSDRFVRGYELYVIDGHSFILHRNILKYNFLNFSIGNKGKDKVLSGLPFQISIMSHFDYGFVSNSPNVFSSHLANNLLLGYGIGIQMVTYYGINISLLYSLNRMREKGLYLHFNI